MQTFGKFSTNFDIEYLTQHYIYINEKDEEREDIKITKDEFEELLGKKRKTVAGTIFLYNPTISPIGFHTNKKLADQGFEFDDEFHELALNELMHIFAKSIKDGYRGQLIEIKYLFNINRPDIEPTPILEEFDADLGKYSSNQLTRYDKNLNYQDYLNIRLNGKFVYFGSGHKHDRHHKDIISYAKNLSTHIAKLGKVIAFTYDNNQHENECVENAYFLAPMATGKMRDIRANAFKNAFRTNPPTIQKIS